MMDPTTDARNLWLLYNGNSEMGSDEKAAWDNIMRNVYGITNPTNSINAALDSLGSTVENKDIKLRTNFQFALNQRAKAIVVSRDHAPRGAFFARLADGRAPAIRPAGSV
jgi:hypothetical protein